MKISFTDRAAPSKAAVVVFAQENGGLLPGAEALDTATGGAVQKALTASRFDGKHGQSVTVLAPVGVAAHRLVVFGIGKPDGFDRLAAEKLGAAVAAGLVACGDREIEVIYDIDAHADAFAAGLRLRAYRFDKYRTSEEADEAPSLEAVRIQVADAKAARKAFKRLDKVVDGVFLTRDLVSEPANVLGPDSFAAECQALEKLGVEVQVLGEKEMTEAGFGALLAVGRGSRHESRLVVMRWHGGAKKDKPLAFVGKGVTFDSGGISIKPAGGMEEMKWDMGGAGVVTGLMKALAGRKAKVNVVGVIGLVENMPSGDAQRPGDVVTSLSGQTIEVINTDAEGRLVLADALWYVQEQDDPCLVVDLATLTGAMIIALGHEYAGLFANDDALAAQLEAAGKAVDEPLWRLPMAKAYGKQIKSDIADMKNVGGRPAGSITAAQFLERFIQPGRVWAHLDIAGVTWANKARGVVPRGGSGFGVRLLDSFVAENYEK